MKALLAILSLTLTSSAFAASMPEVEAWLGDKGLVSRGEEVYKTNCATCHGDSGKGDAPAGKVLVPPARNFHSASSTWTNGTSVKSIFVTLTNGISGTGMAAYQMLPVKDRLALAHFIRTWVPDAQSKAKQDDNFLTALGKDGIGPKAVSKESVPVEFALEQYLKDNS